MSTETIAPGAFCWHELATTDVESAKSFYPALFSWDIKEQEMPGMDDPYRLIHVADQQVGGMYKMAGPMFEGVPPHWINYIMVEDVDATAAKAKELGGSVTVDPMDIPDVGRMAFIMDPLNTPFAIFKSYSSEGPPPLPQYTPGTFCWVELATRDVEKAKAFYTELIGWTTSEMDMGEAGTYTLFHNGGEQPAAGMMGMEGDQWGDAPSHWMVYVAVADCDATAALVEENGGRVHVPPTDIPGMGRFAVLMDPANAVFSIFQSTQSA